MADDPSHSDGASGGGYLRGSSSSRSTPPLPPIAIPPVSDAYPPVPDSAATIAPPAPPRSAMKSANSPLLVVPDGDDDAASGVGGGGMRSRVISIDAHSHDGVDGGAAASMWVPPAPRGLGGATTTRGARNKKSLRSVLSTNRVEDAVFGLAYVTVRDNELPAMVNWILKTVEDFQLLSFALSHRLHPDAPDLVYVIVEPIRLIHSYSDFQTFNSLALFLVFATLALASYVTAMVMHASKVPIATLRVLRLLFAIEMSALAIPIAQLLVSGLNCSTGTLPDYNVPCFGTAHLPLFIIDVIGILVFVPLVLIAALVFLDTSPTSSSPEAKPHGRIDAKIAAAKIIFVFLGSLMPDNSSGNWWYSVLVLGGLLYLIHGITITQPYYDQRMTALRLGLITASAAGMLASMITYGIGFANAWLYVFIPCSVTGFIAGVALARLSARYFFERSVRRWHHVMKEEFHAGGGGAGSETERLATAVATPEPTRPRRASLAVPDPNLPRRASAVRLVSSSVYGGSGAAGPAAGSDMAAMARENVLTRLMEGTSLEVLDACKEKKTVHRERVFSSPLQVEACIRFIREDPTPKQISVGLQLLERGLIEFDDTLLLFIAATYLAAYFGDAGKTAADELIEQIKLRPIPFDEKFLIYARDRHEHESTKMGEAGTSGRGLLDNAEFQNLDRKSKKEHLLSLYTVREFYECVRSQGSLVQLSHIVGKLSVHRELANDAYSRLLVKFPKSKRLLRSYSQFLIAVEGNAIKAGQILEIAEDGDAEDSYDHDLQTDTPPPAAIDRDDPSSEASLREAPNLGQVPILGPGLEPMITAGAVVDSSRTTFPASHDLFFGPEKPMTKPEKPIAAPPSPSPRVTMSTPHQPMPYTTGSQTSGASMTKQQRLQLEHRRMLNSRVTRPLQQGVPMSAIGLVYLAALSAGFVTCITYFAATQSVVTYNFYWAKLSRQYAMNAIDAIHRLLYTSWFARISTYTTRMTTDYATARSSLITNWGNLTANVIPFLANDQADVSTAAASLTYRAYTVVNSTFPDLYDYQPRTLTTLDMVQALGTAGGVALGYPTVGGLTVNVVANTPSVRFIFDNFWTVLNVLYALPQRGIDAFKTITQSNNVQSLAIMTVALVSLFALGLFIFVKPLKGYSDLESRILSLMRGMSKRSAVQIVTAVEEEIEAFKEVTDFGDADMSEFDAQQSRVMASGSDETRHTSSKKRLTRILVLAILALGGLTAGMFATAFQTVSATNMMTLMTKSIERRHNVQVVQLLIRQMIFPDSSLISSEDNVQYLRSVIDDFTRLHKAIVADPTGLSALLPQFTTYLPNATTSVTNAISNTATAGTTIALNPLIDSYLDLATQFVNLAAPACLLTSGTVDPVTVQTSAGPITVQLPSPLHPMWVQLQALTSTIRTQLTALDTTIGNLVLAQVQQATTACILVYAVALIGVIALAMGVHMVAFRRMRNKARTVIALLFLVPAPVLKEHADLAALIESGGMSLRGDGD
ncbi:hypothetical protein AMAG_15846 [Allomyces macrogynus ATCC 38327]|uniref:TmcB/TmcC TPR repeats domain-containing protein n=1 Tax=Allomyces macrogynus (strain ATCC 38327) TaxID=578462 RepID=A0A0L0T8Z4_ALLM3|nr:hypothetical protein AMAG_15846 [Allomyces macrogynus ATCC 38327]|eukprot:KNE71185.1 hypothetical protein AMAG_15846 [Allomyces macrogynus ATCC 38327]